MSSFFTLSTLLNKRHAVLPRTSQAQKLAASFDSCASTGAKRGCVTFVRERGREREREKEICSSLQKLQTSEATTLGISIADKTYAAPNTLCIPTCLNSLFPIHSSLNKFWAYETRFFATVTVIIKFFFQIKGNGYSC
ncbi:hypothetical protein VNO80_17728 [Phaseolus coccineus]|uniref:Uncharacterized protein n=1 Tax=Phaseolus coccineus TaxID=3886 RepID=A0AAN9R356_PHACN